MNGKEIILKLIANRVAILVELTKPERNEATINRFNEEIGVLEICLIKNPETAIGICLASGFYLFSDGKHCFQNPGVKCDTECAAYFKMAVK